MQYDKNKKSTGIIRRLDDLGRICVPREVRRTLRLKSGDPLELWIENGALVYKKYQPAGEWVAFAVAVIDSFRENTGLSFLITTTDIVVAATGVDSVKMDQAFLSAELANLVASKKEYMAGTGVKRIMAVKNSDVLYQVLAAVPISRKDSFGDVVVLNTSEPDISLMNQLACARIIAGIINNCIAFDM